jgi:hypothetical protein
MLQRETDDALSTIVTGKQPVQQTAPALTREERMSAVRRAAVPPRNPWTADQSAKFFARCIQSLANARAACDCASWTTRDEHTFDRWSHLDREQAEVAIRRAGLECGWTGE